MLQRQMATLVNVHLDTMVSFVKSTSMNALSIPVSMGNVEMASIHTCAIVMLDTREPTVMRILMTASPSRSFNSLFNGQSCLGL